MGVDGSFFGFVRLFFYFYVLRDMGEVKKISFSICGMRYCEMILIIDGK